MQHRAAALGHSSVNQQIIQQLTGHYCTDRILYRSSCSDVFIYLVSYVCSATSNFTVNLLFPFMCVCLCHSSCMTVCVCVSSRSIRASAQSVEPMVPSWLISRQRGGVREGTCLPQLPVQRWGSNSLLPHNIDSACQHTHTHTDTHMQTQ